MTTFLFRGAAVLICITLLLLGGCVTKGGEEKGGMFFDEKNQKKSVRENRQSKSWSKFKETIVDKIKHGQGTMTIEEVRAFLPPPNREGETSQSLALGWYFSDTDSSSWDIAIVSHSSGVEYGYLLVVGFNEEGTLNYFGVQNSIMPSKSWVFTTRAVMGEIVAIKNMEILSGMISKALDRAADRGVDRADQKFNATIDRREGELIGKAKDAVNEAKKDMSNSPHVITIEAKTPGGSYSYTVPTGQ